MYRKKDCNLKEVSWTDMFDGGGLLMSKDIGSLSVTSFSLS